MARNAQINIGEAWQLLTVSDVTEVVFQNHTGNELHITATVGTGVPAADAGFLKYHDFSGQVRVSLSDLFLGIAGANRVWAKFAYGVGPVFVSHA